MAKYYVEVNEIGTFWHKDQQMKIRHREHGPAIEYANGDKFWFKDGKQHREDGPAVEWADGCRMWYIDGKIHRKDGPAVELDVGKKQYWLNHTQLTKKKWERAVRPAEEMTVAQIEQLLGKRIKIVK